MSRAMRCFTRRSGLLRTEPSYGVSALREPAAIAVGFTGTQFYLTGQQKNVLMTFLVGLRDIGAIWMHNGDCIESDDFAGRAWNSPGGAIHLHPPTNHKKRAYLNALSNVVSAPPRLYLERNRDIADAATVMLATPKEFDEQHRGGTWYTIRQARHRGLPIAIILPNGTVCYERWPDKLSDLAIAAATGTAKTPQAVECEASQSGPKGIAR